MVSTGGTWHGHRPGQFTWPPPMDHCWQYDMVPIGFLLTESGQLLWLSHTFNSSRRKLQSTVFNTCMRPCCSRKGVGRNTLPLLRGTSCVVFSVDLEDLSCMQSYVGSNSRTSSLPVATVLLCLLPVLAANAAHVALTGSAQHKMQVVCLPLLIWIAHTQSGQLCGSVHT
jgi:hypothetical protein